MEGVVCKPSQSSFADLCEKEGSFAAIGRGQKGKCKGDVFYERCRLRNRLNTIYFGDALYSSTCANKLRVLLLSAGTQPRCCDLTAARRQAQSSTRERTDDCNKGKRKNPKISRKELRGELLDCTSFL